MLENDLGKDAEVGKKIQPCAWYASLASEDQPLDYHSEQLSVSLHLQSSPIPFNLHFSSCHALPTLPMNHFHTI